MATQYVSVGRKRAYFGGDVHVFVVIDHTSVPEHGFQLHVVQVPDMQLVLREEVKVRAGVAVSTSRVDDKEPCASWV